VPTVTVVIPAYNAERTLGKVLEALAAQDEPVDEVIVVDDGSTDGTAAAAERHGARVVSADGGGFAGAARNRGWDEATGDVVVFLDSDAVPDSGWGAGLRRALAEYPGAVVGCARTFRGKTPWGWVAHLQSETPYLPRGEPRRVAFVSSYCMAVPRGTPLRWDPSYGGEDGVFCADALSAGLKLVFDPRFHAFHDHDRSTFGALRGQQRRLAYGLARIGPVQREGLRKRVLARAPLHYFALVRLLAIYRRVRRSPELRGPFVRNVPRLVAAEWTLGASALRYALRRPPLRGQGGGGFR
jgi:glycosyltransferase involved in cell wall biosynthesis